MMRGVMLLLVWLAWSTAALAGEQTFTRTGKYKYSESETMGSMRAHVKEIIIQEVLQSEVGGYSQSMLQLNKQESNTGGVQSSSTQSITQILAGYTKYKVVKEWTDEVYFNTTAEVTVDLDATKRKLDEIAAERKKDDDTKAQITEREKAALEKEKAALEQKNAALQSKAEALAAQSTLLEQQATLNAQAKALADAQAKLQLERLAAQQSMAEQKALLEQQATLNAQAKALADAQAKLERERVAAQLSLDEQNALLQQQAALNAEAKALAERQAMLSQEREAIAKGGALSNFVYIRGGEFTMGSPDGEVGRYWAETQHQVKLSGFYMGKYEVTVAEFRRFIEDSEYRTDAEKKGSSYTWKRQSSSEDNHPVIYVSWNDAVKYCKWLSKKSGKQFRLPTEAEWEYACRAGTTTPFNTGDNLTTSQANYNGNYPYNNNQKGIYRGNTVAVGSFAPNAWGLYDMHGNVWEWCSDWFGNKYYEECKAKGVVENPQGAENGSNRVLRGGSWDGDARSCRSANRSGFTPGLRDGDVGFRLVFVP